MTKCLALLHLALTALATVDTYPPARNAGAMKALTPRSDVVSRLATRSARARGSCLKVARRAQAFGQQRTHVAAARTHESSSLRTPVFVEARLTKLLALMSKFFLLVAAATKSVMHLVRTRIAVSIARWHPRTATATAIYSRYSALDVITVIAQALCVQGFGLAAVRAPFCHHCIRAVARA